MSSQLRKAPNRYVSERNAKDIYVDIFKRKVGAVHKSHVYIYFSFTIKESICGGQKLLVLKF